MNAGRDDSEGNPRRDKLSNGMTKPKPQRIQQRIRVAADADASCAAKLPSQGRDDGAVARQVLEFEAEGILAVARGLDRDKDAFTRAIAALAQVTRPTTLPAM